MSSVDFAGLTWRKSTRSTANGSNGDCVEIAFTDTVVALRDSKNPDAAMAVPAATFAAFLRTTKSQGIAVDFSDLRWRKSTRSTASGDNGECVEVAFAGAVVALRDSKNPDAAMAVPAATFATFLRTTKSQAAAVDFSDLRWRKSSRSTANGDNGDCVEIAFTGAVVALRDSKNPGTAMAVPTSAFTALLRTTK